MSGVDYRTEAVAKIRKGAATPCDARRERRRTHPSAVEASDVERLPEQAARRWWSREMAQCWA